MFRMSRCALCADHTAELADVSFGDAWLPEYAEDKLGRSLVIARSAQGLHLLQSAAADSSVVLDLIQPEKVIRSQSGLRGKREVLAGRFAVRRLLHLPVPEYSKELPRPGWRDFVAVAVSGILSWLAHSTSRWWALRGYISIRSKLVEVLKSRKQSECANASSFQLDDQGYQHGGE